MTLSCICFYLDSRFFDSVSCSWRSSICCSSKAYCLLDCAFSAISVLRMSVKACWSLLIWAKICVAEAEVSAIRCWVRLPSPGELMLLPVPEPRALNCGREILLKQVSSCF